MISKRIADAINKQIKEEFYSAYLYLSMAAYFEDQGLSGFASWMRIQFKEEQDHAHKFFDYLAERGGRVILEGIDQPKMGWDNIVAVFEETLEHERLVTKYINELMDAAIEEKDHATVSFLQWFIDEQVEEEATAENILNQLKLIGGQGNAILMLDRELGTRTYVAPTQA